MSSSFRVAISEITREEILYTSDLLRLPRSAFYGSDGRDVRQEVLKHLGQLDVAACPGSGKTTLLVAKLAILAAKWPYRTRGICVVSHTNVARSEIETRLGNTFVGRRLLGYPHYIGTIHGFVTEFLAVPWLRSVGLPIKIIDTDLCERRRWNKVLPKWRYTLTNKHLDEFSFRLRDTSFNFGQKAAPDRALPFGDHTETYRHMRIAIEEAAKEGYHCYDDMFVWADDLLNRTPPLASVLRDRFPVLFVDEAQDNSEEQAAILQRIFVSGGAAVIRQRFGDENQAIFDSLSGEGASTDRFPDRALSVDLPNSYRFGQTIARLADPLGLRPCNLKGERVSKPLDSGSMEGQHTIFLFDTASASKVLASFAELLLATFSERELTTGIFTAIGQVHRHPRERKTNTFPHSVGDYWLSYDPDLAKRDPKPPSMVQYIFNGVSRGRKEGELYTAVESIAGGILRLAGMAEDGLSLSRRRHGHRYVLELLEGSEEVRRKYEHLVERLTLDAGNLSREAWECRWRNDIWQVAETIAGVPLRAPQHLDFLTWEHSLDISMTPGIPKSHDNLFRYPTDSPRVFIRVGSIHSMKGETHAATLVLETFWRDSKGRHNMELLVPWLTGAKSGGLQESRTQKTRLKLHYVAMTRPKRLLCLAIKASTFHNAEGALNHERVHALRRRGWQVKLLEP